MELTQLSMFEFLKVAELRGKSDANKILPVKKIPDILFNYVEESSSGLYYKIWRWSLNLTRGI